MQDIYVQLYIAKYRANRREVPACQNTIFFSFICKNFECGNTKSLLLSLRHSCYLPLHPHIPLHHWPITPPSMPPSTPPSTPLLQYPSFNTPPSMPPSTPLLQHPSFNAPLYPMHSLFLFQTVLCIHSFILLLLSLPPHSPDFNILLLNIFLHSQTDDREHGEAQPQWIKVLL